MFATGQRPPGREFTRVVVSYMGGINGQQTPHFAGIEGARAF